MFPIFLYQLQDKSSPIKRVFVTQPTTMTMLATMQTLKTKITGKAIPVSNNTRADAGIIFCTPAQLIKRVSESPEIITSSRFVLDEFHTRTVMLDVLFALLMQHRNSFCTPFQLVMMSATPDPIIRNALGGAQIL